VVKYLVVVLLILLMILHQDYWQWEDATLVFGLLPWTLVYHMGLSVSAAAVWWLTVRFCWPENPSE
jgi:hypothetical protein